MYQAAQTLTAAKQDLSTSGDLSRAERFALQRYPVALLAATLPLLRPGDAVVTQGRNRLAETLSPCRTSTSTRQVPIHICDGSASASALVAAGLALHQKDTGKGQALSSITLAILEKEDDLSECLRLAHTDLLPLILLVRGENGPHTRARAKRSLVPAIPVDDADAVALCRVFQESLLRARQRWSSIVIHALHLPDAPDPVLALQQHLRRRGLVP